LAESEERLRLLARVTHDAIWERDFIVDVQRWHEGIEGLLGRRPQPGDADGLAHVHPEDRERVRESLRRAVASTATEWTEEYRVARADGVRHVADRAHLVRDEEGRAVRAIGGITDVTDHKRLEQELLRSQRLESIGTLAGGIAHDLNNVLAPILMSLWTLREGETDPGRIDDLATLEACAQRGADMVHQLLSFARGNEPAPTLVDLRRVATELRRILADTLPSAITLSLHVPRDLWQTRGDATQMHQLLTNFCFNARDAMPRGGDLTLRLENVVLEERSSTLGAVPRPGPHVRVTIEDTGIGMSADVLDRIFEPFFTTKEVGKGTGLGLSTAHAIVRRHHGLVHVQSEIGRGTRFEIYLPAERSEGGALEGADTTPSATDRTKSALVLVVDDEAPIRKVAARLLELAGHRVLVAAHGAEAVSMFAQHRDSIDVVLLDMRMPIMDGPSTVIALRTIRPDVRIVATSGLDPEGQIARETEVGSAVFLAKPYTAEGLLASIERALAVSA
jgi:PAS domain S-box-containing protein